jgi:hypothetical protein
MGDGWEGRGEHLETMQLVGGEERLNLVTLESSVGLVGPLGVYALLYSHVKSLCPGILGSPEPTNLPPGQP